MTTFNKLNDRLSINRPNSISVQIESHPNLNQKKLHEYLASQGIVMQAYAPLARGDHDLLFNDQLGSIGQRYNKSAAQVALRWQLDRRVPFVVKSSHPGRMASNLDLFDFSLRPDEVAQIERFQQRARVYSLPGAESHPDYPFNEQM